MNKITVIVPCYNEEQSLHFFYEEMECVAAEMKEVAFEYLFIDDGSKDKTLECIHELKAKDEKVHYVSFSRNFGKEAAIYAGLSHASGDYVAIMDADLQDPPSLLPEMYHAVTEEGYDSAATRRVTRKGEPPIRSFFARRFYHIMNKISDVELMDGARDYRLMSRAYVDALLAMGEYNRFSKGLFGWVGFKTSSMPLYIASVLGAAMCGVSVIAILFIIIRQLTFGGSVAGWPSMACIVILIGGLQLLSIGILGIYLSKTYLEVKRRPIYIAKEADTEKQKLSRN